MTAPRTHFICIDCGAERTRGDFHGVGQRFRQPCKVCILHNKRMADPAYRAAEDLQKVMHEWARGRL